MRRNRRRGAGWVRIGREKWRGKPAGGRSTGNNKKWGGKPLCAPRAHLLVRRTVVGLQRDLPVFLVDLWDALLPPPPTPFSLCLCARVYAQEMPLRRSRFRLL